MTRMAWDICDDDPCSCDPIKVANPTPLTFEELVWACPICGWAVDLCSEHLEMAREINAQQDEDARREAGDDW